MIKNEKIKNELQFEFEKVNERQELMVLESLEED